MIFKLLKNAPGACIGITNFGVFNLLARVWFLTLGRSEQLKAKRAVGLGLFNEGNWLSTQAYWSHFLSSTGHFSPTQGSCPGFRTQSFLCGQQLVAPCTGLTAQTAF